MKIDQGQFTEYIDDEVSFKVDEEFTTYDKGFLASVELPTCNWAVAGKLVSIVTDSSMAREK